MHSHFPGIFTDALRLGLPHRVTEDDVQFDYFIPKGSLVYANIWYVNVNTV